MKIIETKGITYLQELGGKGTGGRDRITTGGVSGEEEKCFVRK